MGFGGGAFNTTMGLGAAGAGPGAIITLRGLDLVSPVFKRVTLGARAMSAEISAISGGRVFGPMTKGQTQLAQLGLLAINLKSVSREAFNVAKGFAIMGAIGIAVGVSALTVLAQKTFEIDQNMRRMAAVLNISNEEMRKMQNTMVDLSKTLPISAGDLSKGLLAIAKAGVRGNDATLLMSAAAKLATANFTDAGAAAELLVKAITSMGLSFKDAQHAAEVLQYAVDTSIADFQDMAQGMKFASQGAAVLGLSLEDVSGMLAVLTNTGIGAGIAGRELRSMFQRLAENTQETNTFFADFGITVERDAKGVINFRKLLEDMDAAMGAVTDQTELTGKMFTFFGTEAASAFIALARGSDAFANFLDTVGSQAAGNLQRQVEAATHSLSGMWKLLENTFFAAFQRPEFVDSMVALLTSLGEMLKGDLGDRLAAFVTSFIGAFIDLIPRVLPLIEKLIDNAGALFSIMDAGIGVLGGIIQFIGSLDKGFLNLIITLIVIQKMFPMMTGAIVSTFNVMGRAVGSGLIKIQTGFIAVGLAAVAAGAMMGLAFGMFMKRDWWVPIIAGLMGMVNAMIALATVMSVLDPTILIKVGLAAGVAAGLAAIVGGYMQQDSGTYIENQNNYNYTADDWEKSVAGRNGT